MPIKAPDVYKPKLRHYLTVFPFFALARLLQWTVRLKASEEDFKKMTSPERVIGVAWHSRIFFLPMCKYYYRPKFPMTGLVSASKDGAYLCAFFTLFGILAARGSYRRRGARAVIELIDAIANGSDVFITPDGPTGPANKAKAGFATVAKESGARVVALKITPRSYWRISKTWDSLIIPKPFSSATVKALEFANYAELEEYARARGKTPEEAVSDFLNSDNIDPFHEPIKNL